MLALSVIAGSWRTQMRTKRAEVHEAGECNDPEVLGIHNKTTIKLEERTSDTWMSECSIGRGTDQETISQPIVQGERDTGYHSGYTGGSEQLVSERSGRRHALDAGQLAVVDVGSGLIAKVHHGSHSHSQESDHGVRYESPLDTPSLAMDGVK